ncbi:uncharacterized protein LOC130795820 isoform X4 [Actinidia eriantha]|uniref:uncharacterized protein LOC130795820 isoform X4 n=1 Tax=Actinidia eriantha TaxID=165200 RepID=UPI002590977A|nr:uncharacterized protein LOC130795820 isoform X4 [Actinidia eriantha]
MAVSYSLPFQFFTKSFHRNAFFMKENSLQFLQFLKFHQNLGCLGRNAEFHCVMWIDKSAPQVDMLLLEWNLKLPQLLDGLFNTLLCYTLS